MISRSSHKVPYPLLACGQRCRRVSRRHGALMAWRSSTGERPAHPTVADPYLNMIPVLLSSSPCPESLQKSQSHHLSCLGNIANNEGQVLVPQAPVLTSQPSGSTKDDSCSSQNNTTDPPKTSKSCTTSFREARLWGPYVKKGVKDLSWLAPDGRHDRRHPKPPSFPPYLRSCDRQDLSSSLKITHKHTGYIGNPDD
jgi:hypothetical protein